MTAKAEKKKELQHTINPLATLLESPTQINGYTGSRFRPSGMSLPSQRVASAPATQPKHTTLHVAEDPSNENHAAALFDAAGLSAAYKKHGWTLDRETELLISLTEHNDPLIAMKAMRELRARAKENLLLDGIIGQTQRSVSIQTPQGTMVATQKSMSILRSHGARAEDALVIDAQTTKQLPSTSGDHSTPERPIEISNPERKEHHDDRSTLESGIRPETGSLRISEESEPCTGRSGHSDTGDPGLRPAVSCNGGTWFSREEEAEPSGNSESVQAGSLGSETEDDTEGINSRFRSFADQENYDDEDVDEFPDTTDPESPPESAEQNDFDGHSGFVAGHRPPARRIPGICRHASPVSAVERALHRAKAAKGNA